MSMTFTHPVAVRFSDVDLGGVVFNAHYLTWCEDAKAGLLQHLGHDPYPSEPDATLTMVRHAEIDWVASLRPLDAAEIRVFVDRIGQTSFGLRHEIWRAGGDGALTAVCRIVYVCVVAEPYHAVSIPEQLRRALGAYVETQGETSPPAG